MIVARDPKVLAAYAADKRWTPIDPSAAKPWTDDYTNLLGALISRISQRGGTGR